MSEQRELDTLAIASTIAYGVTNELHKQRKLASGQQLTWREQHYWQYLGIWYLGVLYLMLSLCMGSLIWPYDLVHESYQTDWHPTSGLNQQYCQSLGGYWDGTFCEENSNWAPGDPAYVRFYNDPLIKAQNNQ